MIRKLNINILLLKKFKELVLKEKEIVLCLYLIMIM